MKQAGLVSGKVNTVTTDAVKDVGGKGRLLHTVLWVIACVGSLSLSAVSRAADIPLYPTGPSADSSFVRFINGTDAALELTAAGSQAKVQLDSKTPTTVFYPVRVNALTRRMINPVKISVQLLCGDQATGAPLELGELIAGERYSVFAVPTASTTRLFIASDAVAR